MPILLRLRRFVLIVFGAICAVGASAQPTQDKIVKNTLPAIVRAIGFLESAPKDGEFIVAVVYPQEAPSAETAAVDLAGRLNKQIGPKRTRISASARSLDELLRSQDQINAVIMTPASSADAGRLVDFVKERRILSISYDRACLAAQSCVLMVDAGRSVEIVLNTQLAASVGAQFSTVFTMMVNRQ